MPICPVCGDLSEAGAKVCGLCGTSLKAQGDTAVSPAPESSWNGDDIAWDVPDDKPGKAAKTVIVPPMAQTFHEPATANPLPMADVLPPSAGGESLPMAEVLSPSSTTERLPMAEVFSPPAADALRPAAPSPHSPTMPPVRPTVRTTAPPGPPVGAPPAAPPPLAGGSAGQQRCPMCGTVYGPEYADPFCVCGMELAPMPVSAPPAPPKTVVQPTPPAVPPVDVAPPPPSPGVALPSDQPAPGTRCLVLYGPDKKPLHRFPLRKDITLIGRQDPLRNHFPDVNLAQWLDENTAKRVSRKHAVLFHTRLDDSFTLRPLAGNTGTQIEQDMVEPLKDYPLTPGTRLILGGVVRFKFEIVS